MSKYHIDKAKEIFNHFEDIILESGMFQDEEESQTVHKPIVIKCALYFIKEMIANKGECMECGGGNVPYDEDDWITIRTRIQKL